MPKPKREADLLERLRSIDKVYELLNEHSPTLTTAESLLMAQTTMLGLIARELAAINDTLDREFIRVGSVTIQRKNVDEPWEVASAEGD